MLEHNLLELVSQEKARQVAAIDAKSMSTDPKQYVRKNTLTYYIAINTWLMIIKNYSPHAWVRVMSRILSRGLIPCINDAQDDAQSVIQHSCDETIPLRPLARVLYADVKHTDPIVDRELFSSVIGIDATATVLFLLRYPKRFSPNGNDIIQEDTLKDFVQYENRTKLIQRRAGSFGYQFVLRFVRDYVRGMYNWHKICQRIDRIDPVSLPFSSGTAVNARPSAGYKFQTLHQSGEHNECFVTHFGVHMIDIFADAEWRRPPVRVQAVPKSYKASRIIAMDDVYSLMMGMEIERIFRDIDGASKRPVINLEDQSINQELARLGSMGESIATIDASHASDLISKTLFCDIFPKAYVDRVKKYLPDWYTLKGEKKQLQMASTSGNTLTFRHETIVYKAIAGAAELFYQEITGERIKRYAWAYGDDTIVNAKAYDTAVHFFSCLGLIINTDKSFYTGPFRESCGKDYLNGIDVTSIYYPRFPIIGSIDNNIIRLSDRVVRDTYRGKIDNSLSMLIDLQKKIFPYSYDAARFIGSIVEKADKRITYSLAGSICTDMWDYIDGGIPRRVPTAWHLDEKGRDWVKIGPITDSLSGDACQQFMSRLTLDTRHSCLDVSWGDDSQDFFTENQHRIFEYWKYTNFLRYGSTYATDLDRTLGIPEKPITISQFFGKLRLRVKIK